MVRLNSGRWKTIKSFDELMKVKGDEPPLPGHTDAEAFQWCIESIEACLPTAEKEGVMLALENHWGLTTRPENLLRIYQGIRSPWFGVNLDTGNFAGDPYAGLELLAPHAVIVQAKTYYGGGEWYTLDLDYPRIAGILRKAGFKGWVSLEMEGKEDPLDGGPEELRRAAPGLHRLGLGPGGAAVERPPEGRCPFVPLSVAVLRRASRTPPRWSRLGGSLPLEALMPSPRLCAALVAVSVLALLHATPLAAADWPQWRGPELRGTSPETGLPVKWSASEGLAWKLALPSGSGSTPIVSGDRIYLNVAEGDTVSLWCLDRKTAAVLWKTAARRCRRARPPQAQHVDAVAGHRRQARLRHDRPGRAQGLRRCGPGALGARPAEGVRRRSAPTGATAARRCSTRACSTCRCSTA